MASRPVDIVIRAGRIYSMRPDRAVFSALAIREGWIVATSSDPDGLDGLAGPETRILDNRSLTLLPAFDDAHEHLLDASVNRTLVSPAEARSIPELVGLIRSRAAVTPEGSWIVTAAACWVGGRHTAPPGSRTACTSESASS